ncbi:anthranilate phosphoribosyltransferase [Neokomagataea thailandica NBRC 106555]|uniref:Anthranilate phosphoribosyltransferase n=2 Tax=Neokomagataea TaxID=1223423 RepID=A0A4Y6VB72_9PROT|nr:MULTISPECIES: anthranilate phosphoribosyltransferase [Neokomagataea]QDH25615.1 anthranilate phosphoribosyltransferase [Neokomagataea tanensis]GBR49935.1 anthranilate phosphoribosyltransferase [Neokomagataea thailandica NBRC 106555]
MTQLAGSLQKLISGRQLTSEDAEGALTDVMQGGADPLQLSAFLTALNLRGETQDTLVGAVRAVRSHMRPVLGAPKGTIDVCGTGGDGLKTLNVSTAVAFVLAGLDVPVAKHGNRALSSRSGATDVLEQLGIGIHQDEQYLENCLQEDGLVFLAAPYHHPALRHAAPIRKALGFRTLFNLVGPLCNPANVKHQLLGVFDERWLETLADVLHELGTESVWTVHSKTDEGGSDELTLSGENSVVSQSAEGRTRFTFKAAEVGLAARPIADLRGGSPSENARALKAVLKGEAGAYRDTVLLNTAAALHVAGHGSVLDGTRFDTRAFANNIARAAQAIDDGLANAALERSIARSDAHLMKNVELS